MDFWRTHPVEFFWVTETKMEQAKPKVEYPGGMTHSDVVAIYNEAYGEG